MHRINEVLGSPKVLEWMTKFQERKAAPPLVPTGEWCPDLTRQINDTSHEAILAGISPHDEDMALALKAGILLLNDALDSAHVLAQQVHTPTGAYWHAIMHRREPDFGNSRYWFHQTGQHPAFKEVARCAVEHLQLESSEYAVSLSHEISEKGWDPFRFVDRCQRAHSDLEPESVVNLLEKIQLIELEGLLYWTAASAKV